MSISILSSSNNKQTTTTPTIQEHLKEEMKTYRLKKELLYLTLKAAQLLKEKEESERLQEESKQTEQMNTEQVRRSSPEVLDEVARI
jgi:hypothetical protein